MSTFKKKNGMGPGFALNNFSGEKDKKRIKMKQILENVTDC
jgi:hypothetical protein